jgi:NAD+ synthase (glutamine-hydrolysing)
MTKIEEFFQAESLALWDYNRKSGCDGFVISLSGGADSALCAILVESMLTRAIQQIADDDRDALLEKLGMDPLKKFLTCIYQPTANSSQETFRAAELVSKALGCRFEVKNVQSFVVDIEGAAQEYLGRFLSYDEDSVARQNLQARARVMYPWMIANLENKILITTSNRSEAAVGYCTMDGDTAGSLGPIGGVDKEFILEVLDFIVADRTSEDLGKAIKAVRSKAPTAELLPAEKNQTDEGDLMPFGILNNIERAVIIHRKSPQEIVDDAIAVAPQVQKFFTKFARNQWKRERLAVSFHMDDENLDPRSFTRFPILNGGFKVELERLSK